MGTDKLCLPLRNFQCAFCRSSRWPMRTLILSFLRADSWPVPSSFPLAPAAVTAAVSLVPCCVTLLPAFAVPNFSWRFLLLSSSLTAASRVASCLFCVDSSVDPSTPAPSFPALCFASLSVPVPPSTWPPMRDLRPGGPCGPLGDRLRLLLPPRCPPLSLSRASLGRSRPAPFRSGDRPPPPPA